MDTMTAIEGLISYVSLSDWIALVALLVIVVGCLVSAFYNRWKYTIRANCKLASELIVKNNKCSFSVAYINRRTRWRIFATDATGTPRSKNTCALRGTNT